MFFNTGPGSSPVRRPDPRLQTPTAEEVKKFFLDEVKKTWGGSLTYRQWSATDGLRVVLEEPLVRGDRKIHALHLLRRSGE